MGLQLPDLTSTPEEPSNLVDITAQQTAPKPPLDDATIQSRSFKYSLGLGDSVPHEEVQNAVSSGQEDNLRDYAVSQDYLRRLKNTSGMLGDHFLNPGEVNGQNQAADRSYLSALTSVQPKPKETILEDGYAGALLDHSLGLNENPDVHAELNSPRGAEYEAATKKYITKSEVAIKASQEMAAKVKEMGWLSWGGRVAEQMLPGSSWVNIGLPADNEHTSDYSFSPNMQHRVDELWSIDDPAEFKKALDETVSSYERMNPLDAAAFAQAMVSYTNLDKNIDSALNVGGVVPFAGGLKVAGKLTRALKSTVKAATVAESTVPEALSTMGHVEQASNLAARDELVKRILSNPNESDVVKEEMKSLLEKTPGMFSPKYYVEDTAGLYKARQTKLVDYITSLNNKAAEFLANPVQVAQLTPDAIDEAIRVAGPKLGEQFNHLSDMISNTKIIRPEDTKLGSPFFETTFTRLDNTLFATEEEAARVAEFQFPHVESKIIDEGNGYSIKVLTPISTNEKGVLETNIQGVGQSTARTAAMVKRFLASPKESRSPFLNDQAALAVHGTTRYESLMQDVWKPVGELSNKETRALDKVMKIERDTNMIEDDPTTRGRFWQSDLEFENAYVTHNGRLPSEIETKAYYALRKSHEIDYLLRNINEATKKIRAGVKTYSFDIADANGDLRTVKEEGFLVKDLPFEKEGYDPTITMVHTDGIDPKTSTWYLSEFTAEQRAQIRANIKDGGYVVLQRYNPHIRTINDITKSAEPVEFMVIKNPKVGPVSLNQIPTREGWHVKYKSPWYVKLPQMVFGRKGPVYTGDVAIMGMHNEAKGREFLQKIQTALTLSKIADNQAMTEYLNRNLPWSLEQFNKVKAQLPEDQPLTLVRSGQKSTEGEVVLSNGKTLLEHYGPYKDISKSPYNSARELPSEFVAERDPTLQSSSGNLGTEDNPLYQLQEAEMINPIATEAQAMGRLIRSQLFNEYQTSAVNGWIEEFGRFLTDNGKALSKEELRQNPLYWLKHATVRASDPSIRHTVENLRENITALVGTPSRYAQFIERWKQKALSEVYTRTGKDMNIPDRLVSFVKEPVQYAKAMAYHTKMGLFNPVQYFLQRATHVNIIAISPIHGVKAAPASWMMKHLSMTRSPEILDHYANLASKVGWDKTAFKESYNWMVNSGYDIIGHEHSFRANIADPKMLVTRTGKKVLNHGDWFFRDAERSVRVSAWNTAYLEYTARNPYKIGRMTSVDAASITNRADVLSGNMTRDANAFWQRGLGAASSQFLGYQARMIELMLGKQLTVAEKARLGLGWAAIFGATPAGAGAIAYDYLSNPESSVTGKEATSALLNSVPFVGSFFDNVRTTALNNGVNLDDGTVGLMYHGLGAAMEEMITGKLYNVGDRYGPGGRNLPDDLRQKFVESGTAVALAELAMGASGSVFADILSNAIPVVKDLSQMAMTGEPMTDAAVNDILSVFRNVSSVNQGTRLVQALSAGYTRSKNGVKLENITDWKDAIIQGFSGLQSVATLDALYQSQSLKATKEKDLETLKNVQKYMHYYLEAKQRGDQQAVQDNINKLNVIMSGSDMDPQEINSTLIKGFNDNPLSETIGENFVSKSPESKKKNRQKEQLRREQQKGRY